MTRVVDSDYLKQLRALCEQAQRLREAAELLCADLAERIRRSDR